MKYIFLKKISVKIMLAATACLLCTASFGQIRLPRLISDGMVLQRGTAVKIWGWASPNEKVSLLFEHKKYSAKAYADGTWRIWLPSQQAGGPYTMEFTASNKIVVKNILFGDVWVCSGQSNMEHNLANEEEEYPQTIDTTNNPYIRQFKVLAAWNFNRPESDVRGGAWLSATSPENLKTFSTVAFFFAQALYDKYKIPIGIINATLGGSPIEAWLSEDALYRFPAAYSKVQQYRDSSFIKQIETRDKTASDNWYQLLNSKDEGLKYDWANPNLDDANWLTMSVPGYWAQQGLGYVNGAVWFRKKITVPQNMTGKPAKILLGRVVDADSVFINGKFIGTTTYLYPRRHYAVAADVLHAGENEIAIRVVNSGGEGGFVPDKLYAIVAGQDTLNLAGLWKYRLGAAMEALPPATAIGYAPEGLYNAMIAPLQNYAIKGVAWYQGESNGNNADEYSTLLQALIRDWSRQWEQSHPNYSPTTITIIRLPHDFPFLVVQLPNYMPEKHVPSESSWATLRQAQLNVLQLPNTGVAVTIGLGEWNDIHPLNKKPVGERLALQAMHAAYQENNLVYSGPVFQSAQRDGNKLILSFTNVGAGLTAKGGDSLQYFAIAGKDKKFVWAKAEIDGDHVVVWSDAVESPVFVRYAWADNPEGANLYNKDGLPASPFEGSVKL